MGLAKVKYAILTSFKHTIFFARDKNDPTIVYVSPVYTREQPILLYVTSFLVMASRPDLLPNHLPEIPGIHETKKKVNRQIRRSKKYGFLPELSDEDE